MHLYCCLLAAHTAVPIADQARVRRDVNFSAVIARRARCRIPQVLLVSLVRPSVIAACRRRCRVRPSVHIAAVRDCRTVNMRHGHRQLSDRCGRARRSQLQLCRRRCASVKRVGDVLGGAFQWRSARFGHGRTRLSTARYACGPSVLCRTADMVLHLLNRVILLRFRLQSLTSKSRGSWTGKVCTCFGLNEHLSS